VFRVTESDLLHLVDDECVSLISLTKLCGIFDIDPTKTENVSQLTLSMYLLIQSKLQLMHSTATIIEALRKVIIVHRRHDPR
jgi:uridylate kinase